MQQLYKWLLCLVFAAISSHAHAQNTFTNDNLGTYRQDFNSLSPSATVAVTANYLTAIPAVYAEAEFPAGPTQTGGVYQPSQNGGIGPNTGATGNANYYHFGASGNTDRSLGGIGGFIQGSTFGTGYVGIRFKNGTTATMIRNLEIKYAMEHWFNSTFNTEAKVAVSYLRGTTVTSLLESAGTWVPITDLGVSAPSTSTSLGQRDGNAAANRRVVSTTLNGINLAVGEEIMIRWAYVLNSNTNGNGFGIDDVEVTPQTKVYYSQTTGNLDNITTWGTNTNGSGDPPANFTDANQTFYVQSPKDANGVPVAQPITLIRIVGSSWIVGGANSKIIVGTLASPAYLTVQSTKNIAGTIDVGPGSYFYHNRPTGPTFTLGTLDNSSTVEFNAGSNFNFIIPGNQYGNLKATGGAVTDANSSIKKLGGNIIVNGTVGFGGNSKLMLDGFNMTMIGAASFSTTNANLFVITNGTGRLRIRVPRAPSTTTLGTNIFFPVGASETSYTPVTLRQTTNVSDDVFEVGVANNVFQTYNTTSFAGTRQIQSQVVNKTWFIRKEVPKNEATLSMTLQWNAGEGSIAVGGDANYIFNPLTAHINRNNGLGWDTNLPTTGATTVGNTFTLSRSGIASTAAAPIFAFGVSSRDNGALPVELLAFDAKRTGATVTTTWATASEKNNAHFTVERSATGAEFAAIGKVLGAGSSSKRLNYAFEDKAPLAGTAYYRLRQTDINGAVSFSPVVAVQGSGVVLPISAVPNPNTGRFDVWVPTAGVTAIEVTNVVGARVLTQAAAATDNRFSFDLSAQPAGVYLVRLQTTAGTQAVRVVKH